MKRVLILIAIFLTSTAYSQLQSNAIVVDTDIYFLKTNDEREFAINSNFVSNFSSTLFQITPKVGSAASESSIVFVGLNVQRTKLESQLVSTGTDPVFGGKNTNTTTIYSAVFGWQKLLPLGGNFYFAPAISGSIGGGAVKINTSTGQEFKSDLTSYSIITRPEFQYFKIKRSSVFSCLLSISCSHK